MEILLHRRVTKAECPTATKNVATNLRNREKAIKTAAYGPLNPEEANTEFWNAKAERWDVSIEEAKKSRCGNCAAFDVTTKTLDCIEKGIGEEATETINAGKLGYCKFLKFKCASKRTCDGWVTGGPITDKKKRQ